ncbi:MAG: hypothetical protein ABIE74_05710 [Pseudomonadota bacterium]
MTTTLKWNSKDQLVQVKKGKATVDYIYGPLGRRTIKKVDDNGTISQRRYVHQGDQVIEIRDGSDNEVLQVFNGIGIDMLMYAKKGATAYRYNRDHLGNITALLDSAGTTGYTYSYDAFGNVTTTKLNPSVPMKVIF